MQIHFKMAKTLMNSIYQTPSSPNSDHAFPLLFIAVLSITVTAFLLFCYYMFVNKCCSNWHTMLRWVSIWRARQTDDSFIALSPTMWNNRGLEESVIREIPIFQYRKGDGQDRSIYGCIVCLNEFREQEMLRVLPNCSHSFHLDCIDIWLQSNSNCPLCRTGISGSTNRCPTDQIIAPSSSPQGSQPYTDSLMGGDEDFVVIELGGEEGVLLPNRQQDRDVSRERRSRSPAKMDQKVRKLNSQKRHHLSIMGDECIDVRGKDDQFSIQPLRRSFSLDSAVDRQLYLSVQSIFQQNRHLRGINANEGSSNSNNSFRRTLFPFGRIRGSRKAVFPIEFEQ